MAESSLRADHGAATDGLLTGATIAGGRGRTGYGTGADDADDRRVHGHVRACARPPRQADQSIREQTHRDFVCIVSDDASSPRVAQAVEQACAEDERFRYVGNSGVSATTATSSGASGSSRRRGFVALSDQDDVWHADKLETLERVPTERVQLAYADMAIVSSDGEPLAPSYWTDRANNHRSGVAPPDQHRHRRRVALPSRAPRRRLAVPRCAGEAFHDHWLACIALALGEIEFIDRPSTTTSSTATTSSDATNRSPGAAGRSRQRWALRPQPTSTPPEHRPLGAPVLRGRGRGARGICACSPRAPERSPRSRGGFGDRQGGRHEAPRPLAPVAPRQERATFAGTARPWGSKTS